MKIIENAKLAAEVERKLPWFIDIFLYPTSISGIIHLVIFLFTPLIIKKFILSTIDYYGIVSLALYILLIGYILYYLTYCIFDSSKGSLRAPDINMQTTIPDRADYISQIFLILGCIAVCFWPAAVYYIFTQRTDLWFWLLSVGGIFFFPMALLAGVLFDSFAVLNPVLIIRSIFTAPLPYCGMVLFFCVSGRPALVIISNLPKFPGLDKIIAYIYMVWNYLLGTTYIYQKMAFVYLAMVAAHLLGRFYWLHKDKLNWGL